MINEKKIGEKTENQNTEREVNGSLDLKMLKSIGTKTLPHKS